MWTGTAAAARVEGLANGTTYAFRLCAVDAAGNVASGLVTTVRPTPELAGPTDLSVALDGGATWARSTTVTATLGATDASGLGRACLSASATSCSAWFAWTTSRSTPLGGSGVERTVWAWFEDVWGNRSGPVSDTIRVDTVAPSSPVVTVVPGQGRLDLSWVPGTDATSGVVETVIVSSTGSSAPSSCAGTPAWSGPGTSAALEGLVDGRTVQLRVCHRDAAGNLSTGAATSAVSFRVCAVDRVGRVSSGARVTATP